MNLFILFLVSFLVGSIPTGYWTGKIFKGIDIRKSGSGNVGATNVLRVMGKGFGLSVLFFDIFKGIFATLFLPSLLPQSYLHIDLERIALGLLAISGHNWSIFLKFRGGKGIATSLGALIGLALSIVQLRPVLIISVLIWSIAFLILGYVSLASILCAVCLPILTFLFTDSRALLVFSVLISLFALYRHKSNINRLLEKKENRVNLPWLRH